MHCSTSLHKVMMQKFQSHPSINVSPLIRNLVLVAPGQPQCSKLSFPNQCFPAFLEGPQGIARPDGFSNPPWLVVSILWGTFPARHAQMLSMEGFVVLIPEPLSRVYSVLQKSSFTQCYVEACCLFFPRLNPKILQRNLISAAGTCDLIFLVSTQTI